MRRTTAASARRRCEEEAAEWQFTHLSSRPFLLCSLSNGLTSTSTPFFFEADGSELVTEIEIIFVIRVSLECESEREVASAKHSPAL